jgi:NADH dehydrogenase
MGSPIAIDHKNRSVKLDSSEVLDFDYLVIALGSATNDFGVKGVAEHALGMKSVSEALEIRSSILRRFEDLCRFEDDTKLSITVVGGGPTGVEMAGAIAELKKGPLKSDFASAAKNIEVNLVEAGPRILPSFSPLLSHRTKKDLEKLDVKVFVNTSVKEVKPREIILGDKSKLASEITIWAAGVTGEPVMKKLNLPIEGGRIAVDPTLQVTNYPHIFAIGDIAGAKGKDGRFLPMVAPVAMQQGRHLKSQISNLIAGKALQPFKYRDKGSMATIGRHKAVVEVGPLKLAGIPAWYAWLWLHLFYLLGGRNKIGTMADWTWNYLTFDRGNRHIMDIN